MNTETTTEQAPGMEPAYRPMNELEREQERDEEIARRTITQFHVMRAAIIGGDERVTNEAADALLEYLANSPDWPTLIRTALASTPDVAGSRLAELLMRVMRTDAEVAAVREIERLEMEALTEQEPLPRTRLQRIAAEWQEAGG